MGASKHKGTPKWMVKINENHGSKPYEQMDDLGGFQSPYFWLETPIYSKVKQTILPRKLRKSPLARLARLKVNC